MSLRVLYAVIVMFGGGSSGCMKDERSQVAGLVAQLEHVREWHNDVEAAKTHVPWLQANIAWDILGAQTMTSSEDPGALGADVDDVLNSGLAELATGPTPRDMISKLDSWRVALGKGTCEIANAATDDAVWLKVQLAMPVPAGAGEATRVALRGYAERASLVHAPLRITCGGTATLVVGKLADELVPLPRE